MMTIYVTGTNLAPVFVVLNEVQNPYYYMISEFV